MMNLVSVIIPVYNVGEYLDQSIQSLLEQSYPNWEGIFVNDGSTDNSLEILERYAQQDARIRIFTQRNGGAGAARNRGLEEASGEYVYFLDPDDWMDQDLLRINIGLMVEHSLELLLFRYRRIFPGGEVIEGYTSGDSNVYYGNDNASKQLARIHIEYRYESPLYAVWNKVYSRKLLVESNARFPDHRTGEDALFNIQIFSNLNNFCFNNAAYYNCRRLRPGSLTTRKFDNFYDDMRVDNALWKFFHNKGIQGSSIDVVHRLYSWTTIAANYSIGNGRWKEFNRIRDKYKYDYCLNMVDNYKLLDLKLRVKFFLAKKPKIIYLLNYIRIKLLGRTP